MIELNIMWWRMGWWKNVVKNVEGDEGWWFWGKMEYKLGRGNETRFWDGLWSGERSLKCMFPRLFQLSNKKEGRVEEMGGWVDGRWCWYFGWRRGLRTNEKEWEEKLVRFLQGISLMEGIDDEWKWRGEACGLYTVKDAYREIKKIQAQRGDGPVSKKKNWRNLENNCPVKTANDNMEVASWPSPHERKSI